LSSLLYRLGRTVAAHRRLVVVGWLAVLVVVALSALGIGKSFDNTFVLPGSSSQQALNQLDRTFGQVSGSSAQVVFVAPKGHSVTDHADKTAIKKAVTDYRKIDHVTTVSSPLSNHVKGVIAPDGRAAMITVQLSYDRGHVTQTVRNQIQHTTHRLQSAVPGSKTSAGGDAYGTTGISISATEVVGVVVALAVLTITLGSLLAAGMPLLTAILGVGITMAGIIAATGVATVNSTTPMLALMLGLAVGIDYALFILSRHRDQLAEGMAVDESVARSVGTAGSAVIFAGLTVMIALFGLTVARIPFLTTMGVAAAIGVGLAVCIALTLLPALMVGMGERLRPKQRPARRPRRTSHTGGHQITGSAAAGEPARRRSFGTAFFAGWHKAATKWPVVTIVVLVAGLGALALPARGLQLALPDNGTAKPGTHARVTYDLISKHFGPGYNAPLLVTANIVTSDQPAKVMDDLKSDIADLPGVADIPVATPNANADTGIVQVLPKSGGDSEQTKHLVQRIRDLAPGFEAAHGTPIAVTGSTAIAIDVSGQLGHALLPFGILVVGLSLVLLTMVFRSIAVPVKAAVGYLLSIGASLGMVSLVFQHGFLADALGVIRQGPVLSFLPIVLMGILFGLAMDYEVFLVSRMREAYVSSDDPRGAIRTGFLGSAKVVTAAAVIMFSVFAAFIPQGEPEIKAIAVGLATGVFVDAFLIRMTLVPAVLTLLGRSAWRLPGVVDRWLPSFDVEGDRLAHLIALRDWPTPDSRHVIYAEHVSVAQRLPGGRSRPIVDPTNLALLPGEILIVSGAPGTGTSPLLWVLSARMPASAGEIKTAQAVLGEEAGAARRRTLLVDLRQAVDRTSAIGAATDSKAQVIFIDHADELGTGPDQAALQKLIDSVPGSPRGLVIATHNPDALTPLLPVSYQHLSIAAGQPAAEFADALG
jgi:RND superfamily putative drug exporter